MEYSGIGDYLINVKESVYNFGREVFKSGTKGLATLVLAGALGFGGLGLASCRNNATITLQPGQEELISPSPPERIGNPVSSQNKGYVLKEFGQPELFGEGYERPGGITKETIYSTKETIYSNENPIGMPELSGIYFAGKPIYGPGTFLLPPTIYKYDSGGIPVIVFDSFTNSDLEDFSSAAGNNIDYNGQSGIRPNGLYINLVQLDDGSIIVSSNMSITSDSEDNKSSKLFRIFDNGTELEKEVWMNDNGLYGITHIIKGSDGKIYATQVHLTRPNRVISINPNTKNINPEFEIPGEQNSVFSKMGIPTDAQLKIAENSLEGKVANGVDFYVSDLMNDKIYKVSSGEVTILASIRKPTSMVVDYSGNLFVTTAPYLNTDASSFGMKTELLEINPINGTSELLYDAFNEDISDYNTAGGIIVNFDGQSYLFTTGFEISALLHENPTTWTMLFTNSHSGKLNILTTIKDYAPTITSSAQGWYDAPPNVPFIISDAENNLNSCWWSLDSGTTKTSLTCNNGVETTISGSNLPLVEGANVLTLGADNLFSDGTTGNLTTLDLGINLDPTTPTLAINSPASGANVTGDEAIQFTATDNLTPIEQLVTQCSVNNGTNWGDCTTLNSLPGFSEILDGVVVPLDVSTFDLSGNLGVAHADYTKQSLAPSSLQNKIRTLERKLIWVKPLIDFLGNPRILTATLPAK